MDIATYLPKESKTTAAIFAHHKKVGDSEPARGYLGASIIGHECSRYLWYCFRQCCKRTFSGRLYRLFETGDLEEARFVKELRAIGCAVHETDERGQQFSVSALGGHFSGHLDGCAKGVLEAPAAWHVLEFKTHNVKSFGSLVKNGVKDSKFQHWAQMQVYMHLTGMKRALYLARNKDTDDLYSERIRYDRAGADALIKKAESIIAAIAPPDRISQDSEYYQCRWCDASEICWSSEGIALPVESVSCRQCCHATPKYDGDARWVCERDKRSLSRRDQDAACENHLIVPDLLSFAAPTDYDKRADGTECIE